MNATLQLKPRTCTEPVLPDGDILVVVPLQEPATPKDVQPNHHKMKPQCLRVGRDVGGCQTHEPCLVSKGGIRLQEVAAQVDGNDCRMGTGQQDWCVTGIVDRCLT